MKHSQNCSCPHCGGTDIRIGFQSGEGMMHVTPNGIAGNRVQNAICGSCGTILRSWVADPQKFRAADTGQRM